MNTRNLTNTVLTPAASLTLKVTSRLLCASAIALTFLCFALPVEAATIGMGLEYSWSRIPGQPAVHYEDDWSINGLHSVHAAGVGVFDVGDLTDGHVWTAGDPVAGGPSPIVAQYIAPGVVPAADIIFDLGGSQTITDIIVGTYVQANANLNAPSDLVVSYSTTGSLAGDFGATTPYDLQAMFGPLTDGHQDMSVSVGSNAATFVKLTFGPGSMAEPGGSDPNEKWVLDEISFVVPEPSTSILAILGLLGLSSTRRRRRDH